MNTPKISLQESLFDSELIKTDPLDDPEFKKWINQPNTLWYIYYYWESEEDDWLNDFMPKQWSKYRYIVDEILNIINDQAKKVMRSYPFFWTSEDQYQMGVDDGLHEVFKDDAEFYEWFGLARDEIKHDHIELYDGIWKSKFKGSFPKNSQVTDFIEKVGSNITKSGRTAGGICLTNEDTIIVLSLPKGLNKSILKLFDLA